MILLSRDAVEDVERLRTFLDHASPGAARRALELIWTAIEKLQDFPALGMPTEDPEIRQIVVRFGVSGYIIRYVVLPEAGDILVTRVWHGREARI
jgi:plasmid stabilization system protein ParE